MVTISKKTICYFLISIFFIQISILGTPLSIIKVPEAYANGNLVVNGSFEDPALGSGSFATFSSITGWESTNGVEIQNNVAGTPALGAGEQFVELDTDQNSSIFQDISTNEGDCYEISFLYSPRPSVSSSSNTILVSWNGILLDTISEQGQSDTNWSEKTYFVTGEPGSTELRFSGSGDSDSVGGYIDDVKVFAQTCESESVSGFQFVYDPACWEFTTDFNGFVDTSGAPSSISMTGSDSEEGSSGDTDYTINVPSNGNISFDWEYVTFDVDGSGFDPAGYLVNGEFTQLTINGLFVTQSGSVTIPVAAGDIFGFRIRTTDGIFGPGSYTMISNFVAPAGANGGCEPIVSPNHSSGGNSFDIVSPTIKNMNFLTVQDGTEKEGIGGILASFYNERPTQIMETGVEQRLQISVSDNNGNAAITRVVVNMYFDSVEPKGDTFFLYSEKDGLTVSDPLGLFDNVNVHRTFTETEMILVFSFIPQMPTSPISFGINGLDIYGNNQNTNIPNAAQIVGEPNPNTNNLIIPESAEIVIPYYLMPYYEIPDADSQGNLIYYNSFGGLEQKQTHPYYDPIIYPDDVGRAERHDYGFYDKVLAEEEKAKGVASAIMVHPIYSDEQKMFKTDKVFKYPSTVGKADRSIVDVMKDLMQKENVKAMHIAKKVSQ